MRRVAAAVQFLTILPIRGGGANPAAGALLFPLLGAVLGMAAGGIRLWAGKAFPPSMAALLALAFLVAVTGALHEDGLADVFDAFRTGRSPERIQAILKDSRIGVYGAVAVAITLLLRWQAIELLDGRAVAALAAAAGSARGAMVVFAYVSRPLGEGLGKAFRAGLSAPAAAVAGIQSGALPFLGGPAAGAAALCANTVAIAAARAYFHRRAGGVNGDCMGAVCQICEIATLLVFVCRFI